jgi:carbamoyl-phosphate synthase large subunit
LQAAGYETVMVNCNPETVSTDYDTSDRLYFEPLTPEDLANVLDAEQAASRDGGRLVGVIVSLGGQTPLKLAAGIPEELVLGTSPSSIDLAEDRERWNELCGRLGIPQPPGGTATSAAEAVAVASTIGYPVLVRPSYVLGGRAMEIVYDDERLVQAVEGMAGVGGSLGREGGVTAARPVLVDRFLEDAVEVDVDAVRDATGELVICGVMEHVEEAGVHSGDSACALPPQTLSPSVQDEMGRLVRIIADALSVRGLINVQFAVKDDRAYVLEANPRASRTVPFVAKATGVPVAMVAARVMVGATLDELRHEGLLCEPVTGHVSVKEAVLPFDRFEGSDALLGPEMRSTGEVMGIARDFPTAFAKAQAAAGVPLPSEGTVFITVTDADKAGAFAVAQSLHECGFRIVATRGTAEAIARMGVPAQAINKIAEGSPHVLDWIERGDVHLVVNTPTGVGARTDGYEIRRAAVAHGIPCLTTLAAGISAARAISSAHRSGAPEVLCLQELHGMSRTPDGAGVA